MAYAFVAQHPSATASNVTTLSPAAWTPTAGNHLTAITQCTSAATGIAISDGTNTYVQVGQFSDGTYIFTMWEVNSAAGVSTTVTGSVSTGFIRGIYVREDSGLASPAFLTGTFSGLKNTAPGTGTNAIISSATNITGVPAAFIGFCVDITGTSHVMTAGTGFTGRSATWSGGNTLALCEDQRFVVAGNQVATFTAAAAGGSDNYTVLAAAFLELGGATTTDNLLGQGWI